MSFKLTDSDIYTANIEARTDPKTGIVRPYPPGDKNKKDKADEPGPVMPRRPDLASADFDAWVQRNSANRR